MKNTENTEQQIRIQYLIKNKWKRMDELSDLYKCEMWFKESFMGTAQQCAHEQVKMISKESR